MFCKKIVKKLNPELWISNDGRYNCYYDSNNHISKKSRILVSLSLSLSLEEAEKIMFTFFSRSGLI